MIYDIIILGGGPAGYLFALRAGEAGKSVLLIEKNAVGGVCLNEGCIPTKTLLHSAKIYDSAKNSHKFGIKTSGVEYDQAAVIERKNKVIDTLKKGILYKLKESNVDIAADEGKISGKDERGFIIKAADGEYIGQKIVIATGSSPVIPDILGLKHGMYEKFILTSKEILDLEKIPDKLAVIGGGVVGLEMAAYYNSIGSEVTVIEMLNRIAPNFDIQISEILQKNLKKKGIKFITGAKVIEFSDNGLKYELDNQVYDISADKVLLSIGRKSNINGLGLDTLGVKTANGAIITDNRMKTNIENVYAIGDVNGKSMLAHTAYREAVVALDNILGGEDEIDYLSIPSVIYTTPEAACVGYTEKEAAEKGIEYLSHTLPLKVSGRYVCETVAGDGICKMIIEKTSRKIIGFSMIGSYSSEIISTAALIIENRMTVDRLKKVTFPHPSVSEVIFEMSFCF